MVGSGLKKSANSARLMLRSLAATAAAIMVVSIPRVALGGSGYSHRERGVSAYASWVLKKPAVWTYFDLSVFQGNRNDSINGAFNGTEVCLRIDRYFTDPEKAERVDKGCTSVAKGTFEVASDLSSANLQATTLVLHPCTDEYDPAIRDEVCDPNVGRDASVSARWKGTATPAPVDDQYAYHDDTYDCDSKGLTRGTSRTAIARGRVNGKALGATNDAGLFEGLTKDSSTCPPL